MKHAAPRAGNVLSRFLAWWIGELAALLPAALRGGGRTLCIAVEPGRVRVGRRENGRMRELGAVATESDGEIPAGDQKRLRGLAAGLAPEDTDIEISMAPGLALARDVELPAAARENLDQVLAFEMPRLTPFSAEDMYYGHRVTGRRGAMLRVRLEAAPKRIADRATGWLEGWTLRPAPAARRRSASPAAEAVLGFRDVRYGSSRRRGMQAALFSLNLLLAAAAVAIPPWQEQRRLDAAKARLEEVRGVAEAASATAREIERSWARGRFIAATAADRVATVELIEELSARLPDGTWVFRLELSGGKLQLHGSSSAAASLIAALEDSPMLSNVRFASPVVREGSTGRDRFHIAAAAEGGE